MHLSLQTVLSILLGIILAVGAGFIASQNSTPAPAPVLTQSASTTESTSPAVTGPEKTATAVSEAATSSPKKPSSSLRRLPATTPPKTMTQVPPTIDAAQTPPAAVAQSESTPTGTTTPLSLNDRVRESVVNIVCTTQAAGPFESISGSGVVIDSRGIILTNSHVAQFFLLKDYPTANFVNCIIRTGSPAYPRYTAKLLFMPPSWVQANAHQINSSNPVGDGEHDYALLLITGTVNPSIQLPASFPFLPISVNPPVQGQNTFLTGYAAGFLGGITIAEDFYAASAYATVGDLYTFSGNTLDMFSIGGTVVAQKGSSGGAVTDDSGTLLGLIVTVTDAVNTAARDLRAISTPYIIADFAKESGTSLPAFLAGDVNLEAQSFAVGTAPTLRQDLISAIQQNSGQ